MPDRVFEVIVWRPIYHNGKFSHNISRTEIVMNPEFVLLDPERGPSVVHDGLAVSAGAEYIKSQRSGRLVYEWRFVPDGEPA